MTTVTLRKGGREYTIAQAPTGRGWFSTFRNVSPWTEKPHGCHYPAVGFGYLAGVFENFNDVLRLVRAHDDFNLHPHEQPKIQPL